MNFPYNKFMYPNQPNQSAQAPPKANGANKYLNPYKSRRGIMLDNFLGGLFWSLGTFIGLGLLTVAVGYFLSRIDLVPIIGKWMAQILQDATTRLQPPVPLQ